ncbi:MAG: bis(5'-nucleosyl)-tetraphosphatase (symmetrical) YqeK [Endomicrobium sp.]|jgi:predicted HD superfamily hydrolase involved in NAD metabolism|nr:bis(5'-nucleosyl)-tetraphosphatase (symmetrical) YqeK [Endomicrobium sp.]
MNKNIEMRIIDYLFKHLSPNRFDHSYNVARFAIEIASKNNVSIFKTKIAGLLHDCAKAMTDNEILSLFKKRKTFKYFNEISVFSPQLLHSFAGEIIAKKEFKIQDKDILNAIKYHTFGKKNMGILEKLIFVSDYVSDNRKGKQIIQIRNLAKKNLNEAFFAVLAKKIEYVIRSGSWLCPQTIDVWNWYVSKKDN